MVTFVCVATKHEQPEISDTRRKPGCVEILSSSNEVKFHNKAKVERKSGRSKTLSGSSILAGSLLSGPKVVFKKVKTLHYFQLELQRDRHDSQLPEAEEAMGGRQPRGFGRRRAPRR